MQVLEALPECAGSLTSGACAARLLSEAISVAVLLGSVLLKLPQILNILSSKNVEGLSYVSLVTAVPLSLTGCIYQYLKEKPPLSYAGDVSLLLQNAFLVILLWCYSKRKISLTHIVFAVVGFILVAVISLFLPSEYQFLLVTSSLPLMLLAKVPQIVENARNASTSSLSAITTTLEFLGNLARIFTTLQHANFDATKIDYSMAINFFVGAFFAFVLLLQIFLYRETTSKKEKSS